MAYVKSFRELDVYILSRQMANKIYIVSKTFPRDERYSLTDQVRRSSRSVGAQIAEAWAKRKYEKHFISKLTDADGEQLETQHWIEVAFDCDYIGKEQKDNFINEIEEIGKRIASMINKSHLFCKNNNK